MERLPEAIQEQAEERYKLFKANPLHPLLEGKEVQDKRRGMTSWSVRVHYRYRALARILEEEGTTIFLWYWIGSREDYTNQLS